MTPVSRPARREFLLGGMALASALHSAACARAVEPASPQPPVARPKPAIRAICFDAFTLFDPRSVLRAIEAVVPERAAKLWGSWRTRQFEYSWLRASSGRYADFHVVTQEALAFAARELAIDLTASQRDTLVGAYSELEPWPDTRAALTSFRAAGMKLAPLSNYSPAMLAQVIAHAKLEEFFDALISTDAARTFKPAPRAYALGPSTLGLAREEIAFAAFGGWDAAGARWFGFPTFWVNRLGEAPETLEPGPDASGPTFTELAAFVRG